jgi:uncharacterized protein YlzI (FlbEa/FlbD family)
MQLIKLSTRNGAFYVNPLSISSFENSDSTENPKTDINFYNSGFRVVKETPEQVLALLLKAGATLITEEGK